MASETMSTTQMLFAIAAKGSSASKLKAQKILEGKTTVEKEVLFCGSFMKAVLKGEYENAMQCADVENRLALLNHKYKDVNVEGI